MRSLSNTLRSLKGLWRGRITYASLGVRQSLSEKLSPLRIEASSRLRPQSWTEQLRPLDVGFFVLVGGGFSCPQGGYQSQLQASAGL